MGGISLLSLVVQYLQERALLLSELRRSHFLRAIGVVSSSAIAATLRGVKRARQLSPASLGRRVVQFQRDSPMRFFFLLS